MARERWFYAQDRQRRGPAPLGELVESVLKQGEPRLALVWRKGLADWTPAADIPEVERHIALFLARKAAEAAARRAPAPAPAPVAAGPPSPTNPMLLYGGVATGVIVTGLVAWLLWPRSEPAGRAPRLIPLGGTTAENAPAVVIPAPLGTQPTVAPEPSTNSQPTPTPTATPRAATPPPAPPPPPATATATAATAPPPTLATAPPLGAPLGARAAAFSGEEQEIPVAELRSVRHVAAWTGTTLELTVYNETTWRITEVYVRIQRYVGTEVEDDGIPVHLVPPEEIVDEEIASLLSKVAPDRSKPGVNPADTGRFAGEVGPPPEGFRCEIVSARGYPPS